MPGPVLGAKDKRVHKKDKISAHGMYSLLEGDLCIYVLSCISGDETHYKKNKLLSEGRVVEGWAEWVQGSGRYRLPVMNE